MSSMVPTRMGPHRFSAVSSRCRACGWRPCSHRAEPCCSLPREWKHNVPGTFEGEVEGVRWGWVDASHGIRYYSSYRWLWHHPRPWLPGSRYGLECGTIDAGPGTHPSWYVQPFDVRSLVCSLGWPWSWRWMWMTVYSPGSVLVVYLVIYLPIENEWIGSSLWREA
jgi:hypothetical protein